MARIAFRQGIVSHQTDTIGTPVFLDLHSGNVVDLIVSPDPTILTFVHGDNNYLYTENRTIKSAWIIPSSAAWLYWDLSLVDGIVSRGVTELEPIESDNQPTAPVVGQMWYKPRDRQWRVWNGQRFFDVVRVFAAKITSDHIFRSMSINAPQFTGTQVGLNQSNRVGSLVYGNNGKAIKNTGTNTFFTTEDDFITGVPTGASLRINNLVLTGEAICPLAPYQVVQYNSFGTICAANPSQEGRRVFGIIERGAATGEVVNFITEGIIFNEQWDWITLGATVNDPLYIDSTGQLIRNNSARLRQPVAVVIGRKEILFAPRLFIPTDEVAGVTSTSSLTPQQEAQLDNLTTITSSNQLVVTNISEQIIPTIITSVDDNANNITQLQQSVIGYTGSFAVDDWSGSSLVISQNIHQLPLNILYHVTVLESSTNEIVTVPVQVDVSTGNVTISSSGPPFAGRIRIT